MAQNKKMTKKNWIKERIYWHGTNRKNANKILKDGYFKKGTWFAHHLEDALEFGGNYVFAVLISFEKKKHSPKFLSWQKCCANKISTDKVLWLEHFQSQRSYENKELCKEFFGDWEILSK